MVCYVLLCLFLVAIYRYLGDLEYTREGRGFHSAINSFDWSQTYLDRLYLQVTYVSGFNQQWPSMNIYNFYYLSGLSMVLHFYVFLRITSLIPASFVVACLGLFLPKLVLDVWCERKNRTLASKTVTWISLMSRWSIVHEDVYYCLEKSSDGVAEPLKTYLEAFNRQVKYTGLLDEGFQELLLYSNNALYRNFVINLRQAARSKGDLCMLLERLEEEAYLIEGEHARLRSNTYFDRLIIACTAVLTLILGLGLLAHNPLMRFFYFHSRLGQVLFTLYLILFLQALYVASRITTFNY